MHGPCPGMGNLADSIHWHLRPAVAGVLRDTFVRLRSPGRWVPHDVRRELRPLPLSRLIKVPDLYDINISIKTGIYASFASSRGGAAA